jgi:hypothetical protein
MSDGKGATFLDLDNPATVAARSPFVVAAAAAPPSKPAITRVPPSSALERARMFLATADQTPPPANLEDAEDDEASGQVITLNLGLAPADAVPPELFRKE